MLTHGGDVRARLQHVNAAGKTNIRHLHDGVSLLRDVVRVAVLQVHDERQHAAALSAQSELGVHLAHLVHLAHAHGGHHHEARLQVVHRGQGVCFPEAGVQLHHRHEVAHFRLERLASLNVDVFPGAAGTVGNVAGVVRVNGALAVLHGLRPVADLVHVVAFGIEHHQRQVNVHALIPEAEEADHAGGRQMHRRGVVSAHTSQGGAGTAGVQRHDRIAHLVGQVDAGLGKTAGQANLDQTLQQIQHRRAVLARRNHGGDTGLG